MKFNCYEEGSLSKAQIVTVRDGTTNPRAMAAAEFCASKSYDYPGTSPVDVIVCPLDDAARALPGWIPGDDDDPKPYVCVLVTPQRKITWTAEQVHGFNEYGAPGVTHGRVAGGECGSAETD